MVPVFLAVLAVLGSLYYVFLWPDPLCHVPGPRRVPIFGTLFHLEAATPHLSMERMARKYGPVFRMVYMGKPCVVACDFESIHQVLVSKSGDFSGRPSFYMAEVFSEGQAGIGRTDAGQEVRGRRKFVQKYLKQYGSGMQRIEEVTTEATRTMVEELMTLNGEAVDMSEKLLHCVTDILSILVIGKRMSEEAGKETLKVFSASVQAMGTSVASELINAIPWMRHLPNPAYKAIVKCNEMKNAYISNWLHSKPSYGLVSNVNELDNAALEKFHLSEKRHKVQTIFDVFAAGLMTTTSTLGLLINVLCHNGHVQEKLRQEINDTVGESRSPSLEDREKMPYHMATLLEINRYASVAPLGVPHKSTCDTSLQSHGTTIPIPAGTEVITHLWSMHHSDGFWPRPFEFDPSRFLDPRGRLVAADHPNRKHVMAFGAGHRVCVGEVFAMSRMFLILAHLLQGFRILPEGTLAAQPSCDPRDMRCGSISLPRKYRVRLMPAHLA
jgi:cytochrome P450